MESRVKQALLQAGKQHDNFYIYDQQGILDQANRLKSAFPNVSFLYSVKCNPHPQVLSTLFGCGFGADAASFGEVELCLSSGLSRKEIYYSAPGKTASDIEKSLGQCTLIADSLSEIRKIQVTAQKRNLIIEIGLRINPNFGFSSSTGCSSKFGIDESQALSFLESNTCPNVKITGIHVHLRSQELNMDVLDLYYRKTLTLADRFLKKLGRLDYVNMGSGIGVSYAPTDAVLDVTLLGRRIHQELDRFCKANPSTRLFIETGRYVVCGNGWYITRVIDKKVSHGKTYVILRNTLNGFLRPSLAQLIAKYTDQQQPQGSEPLFTSQDAFGFIPLNPRSETELVTLVGNLCTATDVIANDIVLPVLHEGDLVAISNAGAYAAVLSPMQFSSQPPPAQLFLSSDNQIQ